MTDPKRLADLDAKTNAACGTVSNDEARAILSRFVNSHFKNPGEHARASIPADPKRDDDLRLAAYIAQRREADAEITRLRARVAELEAERAEMIAAMNKGYREGRAEVDRKLSNHGYDSL